ncbi:hypothetical protein ACLMR0_006664, partial [Pseudomonas aeruginosa]
HPQFGIDFDPLRGVSSRVALARSSQQGTRLDISFEACMAYVEHGAFDPAIPDRVPAAVGVAGPGEARAGTAAPMAANSSTVAPESAGTRVTVVNSGKPGLLW